MSLRWSDERAKIAAAFVKAQGEFGPAKKGKVNPHFKNKYADLGEIWDACSDALAANDIAIIQSPGEFLNGAVGMDSLLLHSSGEWVCGSLSIPIGNKVDAQAYGSATTYARRYALAAMLGIIQEDDDGNAASRPAPKRDEARKAEPIPASVQMMLEKIGEAETAMALKSVWETHFKAIPAEYRAMVLEAKDNRKLAVDAMALVNA
jgi:hypothetical protein